MFLKENIRCVATIAEYNPFHLGHKFHLENSRTLTGADYVIVLMSGDFVQRGMPAVFNKYIRTRMALQNGADLVIELPAVYALSSAEGFAQGGITLLEKLGIIDFFSFGSEVGDINPLQEGANMLLNSSPSENEAIQCLLKEGISYPKAIKTVFAKERSTSCVFDEPNNILAIEYLKALQKANSSIKPVTIKRKDNGYSNNQINSEMIFNSASSIRSCLFSQNDSYQKYIPENCIELFSDTPVRINDFSNLLYYKLSTLNQSDLTDYLDVSEELAGKILKNLKNYKDIESFIEILKSKNLTYSRISRALFHILLDIKKSDSELEPSYARILGFKKDAKDLLGILKENSKVPIISKLADAQIDALLDKDIRCSNLYSQVSKEYQNEYRQEIIKY